jgi:hypothetical protein
MMVERTSPNCTQQQRMLRLCPASDVTFNENQPTFVTPLWCERPLLWSELHSCTTQPRVIAERVIAYLYDFVAGT